MSSDPRIGTLIAHYRIERVLGRGGMGVVYLAMDQRLERRVALKVLAPELIADPSFQERFAREARMAAATEHPNIIPIYETGEEAGLIYLAMRFIDGKDLGSLVDEQGRLPAERTIGILRQVAGALDAAHSRGIVHRDVKPANMMVASGTGPDATDHIYLTDFGLTKRTTGRTRLTAVGQFVGTIDYVAPEQVQGADVDGRTDQYSLACVAFECLTGEVPYRRPTEIAVVMAHLSDAPPAASELRAELTSRVDAVLSRGMAKSLEDRYPSCIEFVISLRQALQEAGAVSSDAAHVVPPTVVSARPPAPTEAPPAKPAPAVPPVLPIPPPPPPEPSDTGPGAQPAGAALHPEPSPPGAGPRGAVVAPPIPKAGPEDRRGGRRRGMLLLAAAVVVLLAAAGVGAFLLLGPGNEAATCAEGLTRAGQDVGVATEQIFVMNADGSNPTRVSQGEFADSGGSWRPDCSQVVFAREDAEGLDDILIMNADGSGAASLVATGDDESGQFWSSRDDRIVFAAADRDGQRDLFVINPDGAGLDPLTDDAAKDSAPQISPDGRFVAYTKDEDGNTEIHVMEIDTREDRRLTDDGGERFGDNFATWSPDGEQIAWSSTRNDNPDIWVMSVDNPEDARALTEDEGFDKQPSWSNDGNTIAWWSDRDGNANIYVMDADTGDNEVPITSHPDEDRDPAWSPDDRFILFTRSLVEEQ